MMKNRLVKTAIVTLRSRITPFIISCFLKNVSRLSEFLSKTIKYLTMKSLVL